MAQTEAQLRYQKALLAADLASPGVQMLFYRLHRKAEAMAEDYDKINFATESGIAHAMRIQALRDVIQIELPEMIEKIMNVDESAIQGKRPWTFLGWIKSLNIKNIVKLWKERKG